MDEARFYDAVRHGRPYFGPKLASGQGNPRRHGYMRALVVWIASLKRWPSVRILEVGSWAGGSAVTWARALEESSLDGRVTCVDHWTQYLDPQVNDTWIYSEMGAALHNDAILKLFQHNIKACEVEHRIISIRGHSADVLPGLAEKFFQIVFVDASHAYADVRRDLSDGERLVCDGGILCGDDLELQTGDFDERVARVAAHEARDYLRDPQSGQFFHPGVALAVGERFGRVSAWEGFWAVLKHDDRWGSVELGNPEITVPEHLSAWSAPETGPPGELIATAGDYNLVRVHDRVLAVSKRLGPVDLLQEPIGARELEPHVLVGTDVDDLKRRAEALTASAAAPKVEFVEECGKYNLVTAGGKVYAIKRDMGPVNLLQERLGARELAPWILVDDDLERLRRRVRRK